MPHMGSFFPLANLEYVLLGGGSSNASSRFPIVTIGPIGSGGFSKVWKASGTVTFCSLGGAGNVSKVPNGNWLSSVEL